MDLGVYSGVSIPTDTIRITPEILALIAVQIEKIKDYTIVSPMDGIVLRRDGEIGEPEVLLSPLSYIWTHAARLEVFSASGDPDAHLDTLLTSIAAVLGVDPTLGGEIDQMEIGAPDFDGAAPEGGPDVKAAIVPIRLVYETSNPLT